MFRKEHVKHVFQPVFCCRQERAIGFEALMRHQFISQQSVLFKVARELDNLYRLDTMSIEKVIEIFNFEKNGYLFLNIFPTTLLASEFPDFLGNLMRRYRIIPNKVVFELNETCQEEEVWDIPLFKERISLLRQLGFVIALDDVGVGAASIKRVIEIQPDIIKMDRYFSRNLSQSSIKQEVLTLFVVFCKHHESILVLEGIEESIDFITAKQLNVPFLQGYYIGKPLPYKHIEKEMINK